MRVKARTAREVAPPELGQPDSGTDQLQLGDGQLIAGAGVRAANPAQSLATVPQPCPAEIRSRERCQRFNLLLDFHHRQQTAQRHFRQADHLSPCALEVRFDASRRDHRLIADLNLCARFNPPRTIGCCAGFDGIKADLLSHAALDLGIPVGGIVLHPPAVNPRHPAMPGQLGKVNHFGLTSVIGIKKVITGSG